MAIPKITELALSNDAAGSFNPGVNWEAYPNPLTTITTSITLMPAGVATTGGKITDVILMLQGGADTVNPLSMTAVVKKNGTDVASTDAAISFHSGAGTGNVSTYAAGTGITQVVLKTDGTANFVAGDFITVDFNVIRTASPGTEMSNVKALITGVKFTS